MVVGGYEIIDSTGLLVVRVLARRPSIPSRMTVDISSSPNFLFTAAGVIHKLQRCAFPSEVDDHATTVAGQLLGR